MTSQRGLAANGGSQGIEAGNGWWLFAGGILVLAIIIGLAFAGPSNVGFEDAAAVIAFATMVAVGIERTLEIGWTLVDRSRLGAYWPMSVIKKQITEAETQTNQILGDVLTTTTNALNEAKSAAQGGSALVADLDLQIARLQQAATSATSRLDLAQKLAPGSTRIANAAGAADTVTTELRSALNLLGTEGREAGKALDIAEIQLGSALDVIASIQDNPFRRLSSLMLGAAAGTLIASFVGVNLFAAISDAGFPILQGALGVVITGIVTGLGSGPTHELVKNLQANKKAGQSQPVPTRGLPTVQSVAGQQAVRELVDGEAEAFIRAAAAGLAAPVATAPPVPRRTVYIRSTD